MNDNNGPIFIVGANRSGTTLLRLMLNAHPRVAIPEELLYFRSFYAGCPVESWRQPDLSPSVYAGIVRDFVDRTAQLHPELDAPAVTREILNNGPHDLRRPYSIVLDRWARHHGKPRWGEKTPGNLFYVDIIRDMYPEARFLHVVRDPRAGVASMQKTDFFPDDIAFNALSRRKHDRVGRRLLETHVAPDHWMVVRYEDLTTHPETVLCEVCTCIGEKYDPAMLAYHETSSAFMKEEAAATFNAAATQPVTAKKIDAWKQTLTDRDVALIESICTTEMRRYGYEPTATDLPLDVRLERRMKSAYWHLQSLRNRHNRHYTVKHPAFARLRTRLRDFFYREESKQTS
jgi:hypothetical protein